MNARAVVLALAAIGIPIALIVTLLPLTWGYAGMSYGVLGVPGSLAAAKYAKVFYVDPQGPAYRAGIRQGDTVIATTGVASVEDLAGPAGTVMTYRIVRKDRIHPITVTFVPFSGALAVQERFNKVFGALTALAAFGVAILVSLRARERAEGTRAAGLLFFTGFGALSDSLALVCGNAWFADLFSNLLPPLITAAAVWCGLALLAIYPPPRSRLRDVLVYAGPLFMLWGVISDVDALLGQFFTNPIPGLGFLIGGNVGLVGVPLLFNTIVVVQIVAAMGASRGAYRTPVSWLGGLWLTAILIGWVPQLARLAGSTVLLSHYGDALNFVKVFCLAFGIAYPVLRHRLVDLNILITRAGVYAIVSAIIVGVFIAGEWALGKIFETSLGFSKESGGFAPQMASLVLVLILGISARSIHRFVEDRLTNTFFRKRMAGLATIERVAHEADSASDVRAYTDLAARKVEQSLETIGAAFYLRSGERYVLSSISGAPVFPPEYAFNDEAPLALRRWQKPFESEDRSERAHHLLFLPMCVLGDLVGFLCCGPKTDHTAYLPDEISALALLADRAGIASVLLNPRTQAATLPSPSRLGPTAV